MSDRLLTLFLYMVAELSALQQIVNALTGLDGLPVVIVEAVVTTIYTCMGLYLRPAEVVYSRSGSARRPPHFDHHGQYPGCHGPWPHLYRHYHNRR